CIVLYYIMLIYIVHYLTRGIYTHHGGQSAAHGDPGERKRFAARCIIKGVAGAAMNAERGAGPGNTVWEPGCFLLRYGCGADSAKGQPGDHPRHDGRPATDTRVLP